MSELSVSVTPQEQQPKVPEKNNVEKGNKIFYALKKATHESQVVMDGRVAERSLDLRARRADLYKEIVDTKDPERRKELLKDAHARDSIEAQYLSQGEVEVEMPGLGKQTARYTMIEPPAEKRVVEENKKPPIFLIPGISNDLDSVGSLIKEVAFLGREIISVGMPDSQMGHATNEFADAVTSSPTLEPHVRFFKSAIDELVGKDEPIELWGMSAGSMIAAEILNDPAFQERVKNAVLLSPAGTSEQSVKRQNIGVVTEALRVFKNPSKGAHYSLTMARNEDQSPKSVEDKAIAGKIFNTIREKTLGKFEPYKTMKVAEGGQITVVSGKKDNMTRSRESDEDFRMHPQTELISIQNGVHNTPIIEANVVLPEVFEKQKISEVRSDLT